MIKLENIANENHKDELKEMLFSHYDEIIGPDWANKIPIKKLREQVSLAHYHSNNDVNNVYDDNSFYQTFALGIIDEETSKVIGVALLEIIRNVDNKEKYGQLYQLYIKPEYRTLFDPTKEEAKRIVQKGIEEYFKEKDIDEIVMLVPNNIDYLISLSKDLGFKEDKDNKYTPDKNNTPNIKHI